MASGASDFKSWFDKTKDSKSTIGGSAAASSAPGSGSGSSSSSLFGSFFSRDQPQSQQQGGDEENASETSSFLPGFVKNPFSSKPAAEQQGSDWTCGLSMAQRFQLFLLFLIGSGILFSVSLFVFLPMVILMPSKFATTFTFASLLFMAAMAIIRGPKTMLKGLLDKERLPFTVAYLLSLLATLYATFVSQSYFIIVLAVALQVAALLWYGASLIPGGTSGMGMLTRLMFNGVASSGRGVMGMAFSAATGGR